jgi:very-short-patch-repair endonuclease
MLAVGLQPSNQVVMELAGRQHGVVTRAQLLALGVRAETIDYRTRQGRLHRASRGVYALGRPQLPQLGRWMAAVLACGPQALLSHGSAAALWGIRRPRDTSRFGGGRRPSGLAAELPARTPEVSEVSVPSSVMRRRGGIRLHRRALVEADRRRCDGIPVTSPSLTLVDLGARLSDAGPEAAINEADRLGLVDPETLRAELARHAGVPGVVAVRRVLDARTFRLTDSELERRFLRLVRRAGLPVPETGCRVNGFKVDFCWPELGLVVETDGLRYHRTPSQQTRDRLRDQAHARRGLTPLRFTHQQVRFDARHVIETLAGIARRSETRSRRAG